MISPVLFAVEIPYLFYLAPLIVSISLVYAATRHEYLGPILRHAVRFGGGIVLFMFIVWLILALMDWAVSR